ncbi:hypothetical protein NC969_19310 [Leptolyngbya subtilissima ST-M1]|uniref:hypothetical protein n=1 Tax=Cyanophyceae TaxID=3028117 RepID=UPI001F559F17|nr:hypothetical protein [Nodosilinea sp. FACHB-131]
MNTTPLGSRLIEVFVEVRPKSTLRIDLEDNPTFSLGAAASPVVLTGEVWFIGIEAACDMVIDSEPFIEHHKNHQPHDPATKLRQKPLRTLTEIRF